MTDEPRVEILHRSKSGLELRVGSVRVSLQSRGLEHIVGKTPLDAVVSSDDAVLSGGGGVSAVIAALAGGGIRDEVASLLPLPVGAVAVTSGGEMPVRYVLHAVTVDWKNHVLPTERTIRRLLREILTRCEALRIRRIAIPALATGAAGLSPEVSAINIVRALQEHCHNPTVLQSVILPVPDDPVRGAFAMALLPALDAERVLEKGSPLDAPRSVGQAGAPTVDRLECRVVPSDASYSRPVLNRRYVLLEEVGRGGMAVVHLAWDLVLRRTVAIKALRPELAGSDSLFREASAALELTHRGIVRMYHFEPGATDGQAFLVMEYVSWPSGEKWIADAGLAGLPVRSVADVGARLCEALAYAHGRGVVHLDVKPSNVFVEPGGEEGKLGDFGLARVSGPGGSVLQLRPSGTPAYMAPEQRRRGARVGPSTDVYQLAATLWDFLVGVPPQGKKPSLRDFEPERRRLLGALHEVLEAEPERRPSPAGLAEIVTSVT